ncbi:MAG: hypothetical protein ACR2K5_11975, partial [Pseudolabrys sp.]
MRRLIFSLSVRTRIIVLAVIPLVGFLANGITYNSSESEVATAFQSVNHSAARADASRDFKNAVADMRIIVKDFAFAPKNDLIKRFELAEIAASKSLAAIDAASNGVPSEETAPLLSELSSMKKNFDQLVTEQQTLGYDDADGLRSRLRNTGNGIERIIHE